MKRRAPPARSGLAKHDAAMPGEPLPLPVAAAADALQRDLETLLHEPFASAWGAGEGTADEGTAGDVASALRGRLLQRLSASRAQSAGMVTSRWDGTDMHGHREWLLLRGGVRIGEPSLRQRDDHVAPAGCVAGAVCSDGGAWLFLRESALEAAVGDTPFTVRDAEAGWPSLAPGIRRRVLWQRDGQAAMLYHAQPGAAVPQRSHGHDEECLMVQGVLFLDDLLLQEGDDQLAPAGTGHRITETDTGVVIYAHGELELRLR